MGSWTARFSDVGSNNCMLGFSSGQYNDNGSRNTYIGAHSGERVDDGIGNVLIGFRAAYTDASTSFSDRLYIANGASEDSTLIYGEFDNHLVGINTRSPLANLHIVGSPTLGSVIISPDETGSGDDASLIFAEDNDNTYSMFFSYDGGDNRLYVYGKSGATTYGPHISVARDNGNTGIGISDPGSHKLYITSSASGTTGSTLYNENSASGGIAAHIINSNASSTDVALLVTNQGNGNILNLDGWEGAGYQRKFVFTNPGRLGIGTTSPSYRLDLVEDAAANFAARVFNDGNNANRYGMIIQAGADDGSTTGYVYLLYFRDGDGTNIGSITSSDGVINYGTKSASNNQKGLRIHAEDATDIINQIEIVDYYLSEKSNHMITGFRGNNMKEIIPGSTFIDPQTGDYYTDKSALVPILAKAVQEQQKEIEELKKQNTEIEALKEQIQELKQLIQNK